MKVALIGGGVMGEAILGAALGQGVLDRDTTTVCEALPARRDELAARHAVRVTGSAAEAAAGAEAVILAVKPQDAAKVRAALEPGTVVLSIMAGVRIATLRDLFGQRTVVRVMPNTPVAANAGMSVWCATPDVGEAGRGFTRQLLGSFGRELEVDDEKKVDMATALSGSGPAYVFLFIEALIEGGVSIGLTRAQAQELAIQTVYGSALYARESSQSPANLRAAVTSPAGTTAAGLLEMEKGALRATIIEGIRAAHRRAVELGNA
ncbi:MAG: pyrroline-5-carboxylate reductase [Dehalococcoidia bacterium]|nr:pyrroline-5-carboxylate reductase [Dehalococcoidia bacterium]